MAAGTVGFVVLNMEKTQKNYAPDTLVLVNPDDREVGFAPKLDCHLGEGLLHRAFSVFVFHDDGRLLLQQRSKEKPLWPLFWSNTVCSHPAPGESYEDAAQRRLREEMGLRASPLFLYKFQYEARYREIGTEKEVCAVLAARCSHEPLPNIEEVADWLWVQPAKLMLDLRKNPGVYTPWFQMEAAEIFERRPELIQNL